MSHPTHFQQLLHAAAAEPEHQRLLFVFAGAELPTDATPAERAAFEAGQGGALEPLACVDKRVEDLSSFEQLVAESRQAGPPWQVVFIAGLPGVDGQQPTAEMVDGALDAMVQNIRTGSFGGFLALNPFGEPLAFC